MEPQQQQQVVCYQAQGTGSGNGNRHQNLPLSLYLSPKIANTRAAAFRDAAQARPGYVRVVESDECAIHVLPNFEDEEVAALEMRRCRIIGLPFAERLVRDPSWLEKVQALPLYDFVLPAANILAITYSGLPPPVRLRCEVLTRWMGARTCEDFDGSSGILVTARVSLNPKSKYQKAVALGLQIVRPQFLEATWAAKDRVNIGSYSVLSLQGLGVCVDTRYLDVLETYKKRLADHGAVVEPLDRAEVLIVKDTLAPLYEDAKKIGLFCAPPLWLDRCFELGRCVPISGELKVPNPKSSSLVSVHQGLNSLIGGASFEKDCSVSLLGCVLCLCYLPEQDQSFAKALAWKCGAFTTLDPCDGAITHALFRNVTKSSVSVSMPVDDGRITFLDIAWLETCVREDKHASELLFSQQLVHYDPVKDLVYAGTRGRSVSGNWREALPSSSSSTPAVPISAAKKLGPARQESDTVAPIVDKHPQPASCTPAVKSEVVVIQPTRDKGVFAGLRFGVLDELSQTDHEHDKEAVESICGHGAIAVRGTRDALLKHQVDVCVCPFVCELQASKLQRLPVQQVTLSWVRACIADATKHPPEKFPHFQPCPGCLPVKGMDACALRFTAVEVRHGQRNRALLEELAQLVGARVVDNKTKWSDITHMVCVVPGLVDSQQLENARKRNKPMVSVQWLFDCYKMSSRQPEERYGIKVTASMPMDSPAKPMGTMLTQGTFAVLDAYDIFISPCVLGSDNKLPSKAEELGAKVHMWRHAAELQSALAACRAQQSDTGGSASVLSSRSRSVVILVEKEEVCATDCPLAACIADVPDAQRKIFVQPSWLSETFSQRRSLPLEPFAALPVDDDLEQAPKRQRSGEGMYAWQSEASTRLTELAEDSRARALQSKQQRKVTEGLRLADLRCKST